MVPTSLQICNSALTDIGARTISSIDTSIDMSPEARQCALNYDIARRAVLRDHPWNFATDRVVLSAPDSVPPAFNFANRFLLPDDFIRVHTVYDDSGCMMDPGTYNIEGGYLLSDEGTLWLRYVWDYEDTLTFDTLFDEALAAYLGWKIAFKITGSRDTEQAQHKRYIEILQRAKYTSSVEQTTERIDINEWLQARVGRGADFVRDPQTN